MIKIKNLSFAYPNQHDILKNVNLDIDTGSFNLLYGPMGSGKTTLLKLIAGLFPKYSSGNMTGTIDKDGRAAMLFQDANQQFAMKTVQQEFYFTLGNLQVDPKEMEQRMKDALEFCGISSLIHRNLIELSGGEKQKVSLAIIVAMDCPTILLDEPFANVDMESSNEIIGKLRELNRRKNKTIIISDHSVRKYFKTANHFYECKDGNVAEQSLEEVKKQFPINKKEIPKYKILTEDDPTFSLFNFSLTNDDKNLIEPENIDIYPGITYLSGQNGVGKTTFLEALCCLHPYNGTIKLDDKNIQKMSLKQLMSIENLVFQHSDDQFLTITVQDEIDVAKKHSLTKYWNDDRVAELISNFELEPILDNVVYNLSGGQKKKLQFCIMLIRDAPVMLLDEPFAGLDTQGTKYVTYLLRRMQKNGRTIIFTSHLKNNLSKNADFKIELSNHRLTYKESADEA